MDPLMGYALGMSFVGVFMLGFIAGMAMQRTAYDRAEAEVADTPDTDPRGKP